MKSRLIALLALAASVSAFAISQVIAQNGNGSTPQPPVTEKKAKITEIHGEKLTDNYFWLREKTNPAVIAHLEAENAYTTSVMKPTEALQEKLYNEILSHIKQTDENVPYKQGGYFYFSKTKEGLQYPIYYRKKGSLDAPEELILDQNELAKGQKFMSLGALSPSDDGNLLAYSTDNTGYRQYTLQVKDLRTGQLLPEKIERVDSMAWANDNKTLFYQTEDPVTKRSDKLWRHVLGTDKYELIYEEKDELFDIGVGKSLDKVRAAIAKAEESNGKTITLSVGQAKWLRVLGHPRIANVCFLQPPSHVLIAAPFCPRGDPKEPLTDEERPADCVPHGTYRPTRG